MNVRQISKALHTLSLLSEEDYDLVLKLRALTEDEREQFRTALELQKPAAKKASKKSSKSSSKSPRATGIEQQLSKRRERKPSNSSVNTEGLCGFQYHDETFCDEPYLNRIHAADAGYAGYHPFQPAALPAPTQSPANGGVESTTQNSQASAVSAGAATGGSSE